MALYAVALQFIWVVIDLGQDVKKKNHIALHKLSAV